MGFSCDMVSITRDDIKSFKRTVKEVICLLNMMKNELFLVAFFKGFTNALNITDISEQILYVQLLKANLKR